MIADIDLNIFKQIASTHTGHVLYTEDFDTIIMYIPTAQNIIFRYTYLKNQKTEEEGGIEMDLVWKQTNIGKAIFVQNIDFNKVNVNVN